MRAFNSLKTSIGTSGFQVLCVTDPNKKRKLVVSFVTYSGLYQ